MKKGSEEFKEESKTFIEEIRTLINKKSVENRSDTPDFILADYLHDSLVSYERCVNARDKWFGVDMWNSDKNVHECDARTEPMAHKELPTLEPEQGEAVESDAIAFLNWTLTSECEYQCTDEDQWTIYDGDKHHNITTENLYQLFKKLSHE